MDRMAALNKTPRPAFLRDTLCSRELAAYSLRLAESSTRRHFDTRHARKEEVLKKLGPPPLHDFSNLYGVIRARAGSEQWAVRLHVTEHFFSEVTAPRRRRCINAWCSRRH